MPNTTYGPVVVSPSSFSTEVVVVSSLLSVVVSLCIDEYSRRPLLSLFSSDGALVALISGTLCVDVGRGSPLTGTPDDLMLEYTSVLLEMEVVPPSSLNVVK